MTMNTNLDHLEQIYQQADCLFTKSEVENALDDLAKNINHSLSDSNPLCLCLLNGGLGIFGKLLMRLDFLLEVDYCHPTRYRGDTTGSVLEWKIKPSRSLQGRTVILIDDILDEGVTLGAVIDFCHEQGAEQVITVVLINKKHNRKHQGITADFVGLEVEDRYVFGYGMDYKNYWRNAAGIYAVSD